MKNTKTKLLASVLVLAVAVVLATTTTFAWFSMNSKVSVTDANMNVTTQGDLLISNAKNGTYGSTFSLSNTFTGELEAVTIEEKSTDTGMLSFIKLDETVAVAGKQYYSFDIFLKSVTPYEIYVDTLNLEATARTYAVDAEKPVFDGIKATEYYVTASYKKDSADVNKLYKITDITLNEAGDEVVSCVVNDSTTPTTVTDGVFTVDADGQIDVRFTVANKVVALSLEGTGAANGKLIAPKTVLEADPLNAMRIAFVANKDDVNVFDFNKGKGWSAYDNLNMAHDYYDMVAATAGKPALDAKFKTETVVAPATTGLATTKLTTLAASGEANADGVTTYTAKLTVCIWIEGADADCIASIANKLITGSLNIKGVFIDNQKPSQP